MVTTIHIHTENNVRSTTIGVVNTISKCFTTITLLSFKLFLKGISIKNLLMIYFIIFILCYMVINKNKKSDYNF